MDTIFKITLGIFIGIAITVGGIYLLRLPVGVANNSAELPSRSSIQLDTTIAESSANPGVVAGWSYATDDNVDGNSNTEFGSIDSDAKPAPNKEPVMAEELLEVWLYARRSVVMRKTPGGLAIPAPSLSRSPLVVVRGSRFESLTRDGEWVLVRSPGLTIGWVPLRDLSRNRPGI